jgi:hypothetical protein
MPKKRQSTCKQPFVPTSGNSMFFVSSHHVYRTEVVSAGQRWSAPPSAENWGKIKSACESALAV